MVCIFLSSPEIVETACLVRMLLHVCVCCLSERSLLLSFYHIVKIQCSSISIVQSMNFKGTTLRSLTCLLKGFHGSFQVFFFLLFDLVDLFPSICENL